MKPVNNVAKISWQAQDERYELRILNKLKAYTEGTTRAEHDAAKKELASLAHERGYTVINDDKVHGRNYNDEYPAVKSDDQTN